MSWQDIINFRDDITICIVTGQTLMNDINLIQETKFIIQLLLYKFTA